MYCFTYTTALKTLLTKLKTIKRYDNMTFILYRNVCSAKKVLAQNTYFCGCLLFVNSENIND